MSYQLNKSQATIKGYFRGRNFMTPEVIEYGQIDARRCYELSTGTGLYNEPVYGVSVISVEHGRAVEPLHDQSNLFESEHAAREHIASLKN